MHSPPHPGRIVKQECLEPLGLSVTEAAKKLGVSRVALSEIVNERRGVSPEMAIRLSKAFGSRPEVWAGLQMQFDLAQAMKNADQIKVQRLTKAA
jgi:addiction module HigA family antidote